MATPFSTLLRFLTFPLRAMQRQIDIATIWPELIKQTKSLEAAHNAMLFYVLRDGVWTEDYSYDELVNYIRGLK